MYRDHHKFQTTLPVSMTEQGDTDILAHYCAHMLVEFGGLWLLYNAEHVCMYVEHAKEPVVLGYKL